MNLLCENNSRSKINAPSGLLPAPCPLPSTLTLFISEAQRKNSRLTIGLFFTRRRLIARFYPALRSSTRRLRGPTHSQRCLILGDREVAPALYIVHSPEINV